VILILMLFNY